MPRRPHRPEQQPLSPAAPAAGQCQEALFKAPAAHAPDHVVVATIDGAARGNPGPAAFGVVFQDASGAVRAQVSGRLGKATNNVAEYRALLAALAYAREKGWRALTVRTDSELLAHQLQGRYKVKNPQLKLLHEQARQLVVGLDYFGIEAVPRKLTRAADKLANAALDKRSAISRQPSAKMRSPAAAAGKRTIRAVYKGGVFQPLDSLDLPDGIEVELTLFRKS